MTDHEVVLEDLDTLVEIARKNMASTGAWLGLASSAAELRKAYEKTNTNAQIGEEVVK